jgi:TatD DNase family protein
MPKLIDSHAHLNFRAFNKDRKEIIDKCLEKDIWMINVGSNFETSRKSLELADEYNRGVYGSIGIHPIHVFHEEYSQECMWDLAKNSDKVVAIGETGLDYFHLKNSSGRLVKEEEIFNKAQKAQKKLLNQHLKLARMLELPIIFHTRPYKDNDAYYDLVAELEKFAAFYQDFVLKGVIHCYVANLELAQIFLRLGLYLGFTGIITFSNEYDKIIEEVPLDKILLETDCPYLSPEPKRGKKNIPQNVIYIAKKIAKIKGVDISKIKQQITQNAINLFNLEKRLLV